MTRLKEVYTRILLLFQDFIHAFLNKINKNFSPPMRWSLGASLLFILIYKFWPIPVYLNGYVEGDFVRMARPFSGQLLELKVREGDRVTPNMLLFRLDDEEEKNQYNQSTAQLQEAQAQLANILTGKRAEELNVIKADIESAKAQQELTKLIYERQKKLVETRATSLENLDRAHAEYIRAQAQRQNLEAQFSVANLPGRTDEIAAAKAKIEAAQADAQRFKWRLNQKSAVALQDGVVTNRFYELGEFVPSNSPVIEILPDHGVKAVAFVSPDVMATLSYGQEVSIHTGHEKIPSKITFISPSAEYTPPIIYSNETRNKLVFRIEARPLKPHERLHPGQPITIHFP